MIRKEPSSMRSVYSGHMRKGKKKTRYTDDEIRSIEAKAYERGRSGSAGASAQDAVDERARVLDLVDEAVEELDGRAGKRKVQEELARIRQELLDED